MRVADLPLPPAVIEHLSERGMRELYPPQAAAVEAGVCEGESVVAAVPTASGKTLIGQLAALSRRDGSRPEPGRAGVGPPSAGTALYVVPLRALATEKAAAFDALPGVEVAVATGDYDAAEDDLAAADVVVATAEKVDAGIRHGAAWVEGVHCAVLDEVHLLDDRSRGPTLEVTIAKLRRLNPSVQLVALSATVPNADAVAAWLDATPVHSDWRPVELRAGIYAEGSLRFADGDERALDPGERSPTAALVADVLARGGGALAFVRSRREARALADELATALEAPLLPAGGSLPRGDGGSQAGGGDRPGGGEGGAGGRGDGAGGGEDAAGGGGDRTAGEGDEPPDPSSPSGDSAAVAADLRGTARTATGDHLAEVAAAGVAFHHAGLRSEHRQRVEAGFRAGDLGVICATPTLAAGVNVPARRVIVRDHRRYGDDGYEPLSTLEVRQMFGRAGRPGLDPHGEAVLVADDAEEREELSERYLAADPEPVTSKLDDPRALRPHVLASVASGVADSRGELLALLEETFHAHAAEAATLVETAEDAIDRLAGAGMLRVGDDADRGSAPGGPTGDPLPEDHLEATELGALVSRVYVDPATGADVVGALERAETLERVTTLTVCEIVCDTAEMPTRYVRSDEAGGLAEFALRNADLLAKPVRDFEGEFHDWLAALKTARLLAEYAEGAPIDELVEGYAVGPGDVRRFAERAEWLCSATESLAEHVDSDLTERIRRTRERLAERLE